MEQAKPIQSENGRADEISLKDLILRIQSTIQYLLSNWKWILLVVVIGSTLGLLVSIFKKKQYVAELTFVVEDKSGSNLSAYAGIASQFGIDLSGGGGSGVFTGDNVLEFLKSRLMIEQTLLHPVTKGNSTQTLADRYLDVTEMTENWKDNKRLKDIRFPVGQPRSSFSLLQDSVLGVLYEKITLGNLTISKPDKKLTFILAKCTSPDETFSKTFTEVLVKEATDFYITTKTARAQINIDKLQAKADTLEYLLNKKTMSVAIGQDLNQNPARAAAGVSTEVGMRDKLMLQTMYGEVIKNLEVSKVAMAQETPVIQIVDRPILPLKISRISKSKGIIFGGIIGGVVACFFFVLRKLYKEVMQ